MAPPPANLPTVESPRGPIRGYVANRSSSGTKTNTPLNEIPQSISVVGAEQIRDLKPQNLGQAIQYSPGVRGETFGDNTRNEFLQIRGFPAEQYGLFLDGLQLFSTAFATWKFQPFGLERVEILRGPAAVLYGGSNASGLVNAISKLPTAQPIRYLETGVNSYGNRYLNFDFGGPVALAPGAGTLDYRILGTLKGGDTQVDFTRDDSYFIAPSITYRPDIDTSITVLAQASKDKTNGQNFLPYVGTVTPAPFGRISTQLFTSDPSVDTFKREQTMIGYQFEKNITDNLTFRQNLRFAHVDVLYSSLIGLGYDGSPSAATLARGNFFAQDTADQGNVDNQLEYRFATGPFQHKLLAGIDYKHYAIDDFQGFGFGVPSLNVINPVYTSIPRFSGAPNTNQYFTQEQTGLYLQDQIKLDRLTLVLSGRNDWVDQNNDNRIGVSRSRSDSKPTGRAGLIYTGEYGLSPYVSYATYYNPIPGTNTTINQLYLPETGQQSEVGVKWQPGGLDGSVNFALFDIKRQNVITTNPASPIFASLQTGELTSRGLELSTVANVTPNLKLLASFTAFDVSVSDDPNAAIIGKKPTNTPSRLASFFGDYTFRTGAFTGFGFGGGVRYVGSSFADNLNSLPVPDYLLGDVAVHYETGGWRAALNVINLGDKTFVSGCSTPGACFYGERRRALASLSYRW